jgi:cell division protein FtsI (penicillin-binding protein 3)
MRDAVGRAFFVSEPTQNEKKMNSIVLTIDKDVQYKAQSALEDTLEKYKARSGQCIIMNPDTGEILAMAVAPSFNPNIFGQYQPSQWRNRTVTDVYEPGSSIKVFLLASALENNIITPDTRFNCENGEIRISNRTIRDTKRYQTLTASDIVVKSSNIGAIKIGRELGYDKFYEYLRNFGFGSETGVDLIGERGGSIRSPANARELDQATVYFGQGMSATSLQLVNAFGAIANGGRLMRPYIVKKVIDENGKTVRENHPLMLRRVVSPETAARVTDIIKKVVSENGTAPNAAIEGYSVAGKTSTAQKFNNRTGSYSDTDYMAVFAGFIPADRPRLAMIVMIDEPRGNTYGGVVAGPVFREIGKWALKNYRIQPELRVAGMEEKVDTEVLSPEMDNINISVSGNEGMLPDFRGLTMREVLKVCGSLGIEINLQGSGLAVEQVPVPGVSLKEVTLLTVRFEPTV